MAVLPTAPIPQTIEESSTLTGDDLEARVIVYNCDCHTYQQVIDLLCRAVPKMTPTHAFELAYLARRRPVGTARQPFLMKLMTSLYSAMAASKALAPRGMLASKTASTAGLSMTTS